VKISKYANEISELGAENWELSKREKYRPDWKLEGRRGLKISRCEN